MQLQWFKVTHKGKDYQEIANISYEEDGICYFTDGRIIQSSRKCGRGEYPLLPAHLKFK